MLTKYKICGRLILEGVIEIAKSFLKYGEFQKLIDAIAPHMYTCKICGRKRLIRIDQDRVLCDICGHYVYKNDELEFKYKMSEELKRKREMENEK